MFCDAGEATYRAFGRKGDIADATDLAAGLRQTERSALPFVLATQRSPDALDRCDAAWDLQLNNHVANRASRAQGHALISSAARIFASSDELAWLSRRIRERELAGHLATLFGVLTRVLAQYTG